MIYFFNFFFSKINTGEESKKYNNSQYNLHACWHLETKNKININKNKVIFMIHHQLFKDQNNKNKITRKKNINSTKIADMCVYTL